MLHILGMGCCHPTVEVDNKFLEDLDVGTTAAWIEEKIGIKTRLTTLPLDYIRNTRNQDPRMAHEVASMTPTEMGVRASKAALLRVGISAQDVGMIVCNTCTPYQTLPTESQRIARELDS